MANDQALRIRPAKGAFDAIAFSELGDPERWQSGAAPLLVMGQHGFSFPRDPCLSKSFNDGSVQLCVDRHVPPPLNFISGYPASLADNLIYLLPSASWR